VWEIINGHLTKHLLGSLHIHIIKQKQFKTTGPHDSLRFLKAEFSECPSSALTLYCDVTV